MIAGNNQIMRKSLLAGILALLLPSAVYAGGIFVECESFADPGGWAVDQQFMDAMGSPYLIAHGMGVPVKDASTSIDIPEAGVWHVYARCYNWTSPWSKGEGPGKFRIKIDSKTLKAILGCSGNSWDWQYSGQLKLKAGPAGAGRLSTSSLPEKTSRAVLPSGKYSATATCPSLPAAGL